MSTKQTDPRATHAASFKVTVMYNALKPLAQSDLIDDLRQSLEHSRKEHALDQGEHYHAYGLDVEALGCITRVNAPNATAADMAKVTSEDFTDTEVDAVLCVFDEIIGMLVWSGRADFETSPENCSEGKRDFARYISEIQQNNGTPELRLLSASLGRVIESIWSELTKAGLTDRWGGAWDFEYVPDVLYTAWQYGHEFPEATNRTQWLAASLHALEYKADTIEGAKAEQLICEHPHLPHDIQAAYAHYKAVIDAVGADALSEYTDQSSSNIEDELLALAERFPIAPDSPAPVAVE